MVRQIARWAVLMSVSFALVYVPSTQAQQQEAEKDKKKEVQLIKGLDGGDYMPYKPSVIRRVQEALQKLGLYQGEVTGQLDEETMKALAEFQKQNGLTPNGIPTPQTRARLFKAAEGGGTTS